MGKRQSKIATKTRRRPQAAPPGVRLRAWRRPPAPRCLAGRYLSTRRVLHQNCTGRYSGYSLSIEIYRY